MKKDLNILFLDLKLHLFAYLLPIVIIYCAFMPYLHLQIQYINDSFEKELTYFTFSQKFLTIFIVYYLWLFIKNYIDGPMVEVIGSMDYKYRMRFLIYSLITYLFILIPYFIMTYVELGNVLYSIMGLIFQFIILGCMFYGLVMITRNSLTIFAFLIVFIMLFTQFFRMENYYILFHVTLLASSLSKQYWIFHSFVGVIMLGIGIFNEIYKKYE